jgi:hypothetical protein
MRVGGTVGGGNMKLGTFVEPLDVMNHATFHLYLMISLRVAKSQKRGFAFEMHMAHCPALPLWQVIDMKLYYHLLHCAYR